MHAHKCSGTKHYITIEMKDDLCLSHGTRRESCEQRMRCDWEGQTSVVRKSSMLHWLSIIPACHVWETHSRNPKTHKISWASYVVRVWCPCPRRKILNTGTHLLCLLTNQKVTVMLNANHYHYLLFVSWILECPHVPPWFALRGQGKFAWTMQTERQSRNGN